jgi:general secretion pathway protein C
MSTQILENTIHAIYLMVVASGIYSVANTFTASIAHMMTEVPTVSEETPITAAGETRIPELNATFIAERNLLHLERAPLPKKEAEAAPTVAVPTLPGTDFKESELQPCNLPVVLRGTLVVDGHPDASIAIMSSNNQDTESHAYLLKEGRNQITEDATLVAIRPREIIVRRTDHFERCFGEGEVASVTVPQDDGPQESASAQNTEEEAESANSSEEAQGVVKVSQGHYRLERSEINRIMANLNEVATQARMVPYFQGGKTLGFKVFAIRANSIFQKIGLQNGDVLQKVNGFEMNSVDRALSVYSKLQDATALTLELMRNGQSIVMNYSIAN